MGITFTYRGFTRAPVGGARRRWKGVYTEAGWKNMLRPPGYRMHRKCSLCENPHLARGFCRSHYDLVFRKQASDLAPRNKVPKRKYPNQYTLPEEFAYIYRGVRDAAIRKSAILPGAVRKFRIYGLEVDVEPVMLL